MKTIFLISILSLPTNQLTTIRTLYHSAIESEASAIKLEAYLKDLYKNSPIAMGYWGANKMVLAKYALLPSQKYSLFTEGRQFLDKAIALDQSNLELRYLRYSIQLNSPSFLGYNKDIKSDRMALINGAAALADHELKVKIISFLVLSAGLTESERNLLK